MSTKSFRLTFKKLIERLWKDQKIIGHTARYHLSNDCIWHGKIIAVQIVMQEGAPYVVDVFLRVERVDGSENAKKLTKDLALPWNHKVTLEHLQRLEMDV